ncbi:DUF1254 domain-containing protein [Novosphingobium sp. BL-8H]|uniref:DUF1254 domain-containing protein n=1 Tax=Novosphingobium sp. BL-8H TaxID=3127640 RepID=UPI00375686CF
MADASASTNASDVLFRLGFPDPENAQRAYDAADLSRAVTAYRFFYPTVVGAAIVKGDLDCGLVPNKVFGTMHSGPEQVLYTTNNDTPYGPLLLDLGVGPLVIELQPGPLIVCSIDVNQRWVADMGLPGPDGGKGGKHILVPPLTRASFPQTVASTFMRRAATSRLSEPVHCPWEAMWKAPNAC